MGHYSWRSLCRYADGELTLRDSRGLVEHIRVCTRCQEELNIVRKVDRVLEGWGRRREQIPNSTESRIIESVSRPRRFPRVFALGNMMPAALGSSVAALLVVISVNFGWQYQNPSRFGSPTASRSQATQVASLRAPSKARQTAQARAHLRARLGLMMNID